MNALHLDCKERLRSGCASSVRSGCKVNLFLDITGLRQDGRHELYSLFWPLPEPHDELVLYATSGEKFSLHCGNMELDPEHNTLSKAWRAFAEATSWAPGLHAQLRKGVPSGAGLGGGSANAAALLLWLNRQAPQPLSPEALCAVAVSVGADVPFFLHNRPALATGIGEVLAEFSNSKDTQLFRMFWMVLLCPEIAVSTAWAFRAWDADNAIAAKKCTTVSSHVLTIIGGESSNANSQLTGAKHIRNSLEKVVFAEHPHIAACKASLLQNGAVAAGMSGSGASVFGLFRDADHAQCADVARAASQVVANTQRIPLTRVWVQSLENEFSM